MTIATTNMLLAAALAALALPCAAQDTASSSASSNATTTKISHAQVKTKTVSGRSQTNKQASGEAASLEQKEAGENVEERDSSADNRGRLTAASHTKTQHRQPHAATASVHSKSKPAVTNASARKSSGSQAKTATLKTGQLTSSQAAHLEPKRTSLRNNGRQENSNKAASGDRTQENQQPGKTSNPIRLQKHNARMF